MRIPGIARARSALGVARSRWSRRQLAGPKLLQAFADQYPRAFFVEIGSNDGERHDHLRPLIRSRAWSGIMVEPVPYVFERLRRNYAGFDRIFLENAAIADHDGTLPFYYLAEADPSNEDLPAWYDAIGSLSREVVLSHARVIPDIEQRIVRSEVPCMTFQSLCEKYGNPRVELLLIDTEGYDYELLREIDLPSDHPRLLIYEHFHLSESEREECRRYLARRGYETIEEGLDTFCLDTSVDDPLTRAWRSTPPGAPGVYAEDEPRKAADPMP